MTTPIILIVVGLLLSFLSPKIFKGSIASILGIAGYIVTIVGIVLLILALV